MKVCTKRKRGFMSDLQSVFGNSGFDTNSVEPQSDFEVLPPGKYPVLIEKAEVKQTKAGTGHYISLCLCVLDGPAKNRKLFDNINIQNPSQQCVDIGLRQLAALGQAIGLTCVNDTNQLVNKACLAHVKVKDDRNEVRTYSKLGNVAAPSANQSYPLGSPNYQTKTNEPNPQANQTKLAESANPPPAGNKPPWMR